MSVIEVKWVRPPRLPLPVVRVPRRLGRALHRMHVRCRRLGRAVRNGPPPAAPELGERLLARL